MFDYQLLPNYPLFDKVLFTFGSSFVFLLVRFLYRRREERRSVRTLEPFLFGTIVID